MSAVMAQWLRDALAFAGISQTDLAARLTARLGRSFDKAAVNKMAIVQLKPRQKRRQIKADEMYAIAEITGFPPPSDAAAIAHVPLLSWVSAGQLADAHSQIPVTDVPLLAFADLGAGEFFALRVQGDSMDRVSPDGSTIVVNRADRTLVQGRCYVFAVRGETTYKRWQNDGPAYLEPFSTNPGHKPIFVRGEKDFEVIGRVKRTLLDL